MELILTFFAANDLSLGVFDTPELASGVTRQRFLALRRLAKAMDGEEQTCVVCSGAIREVRELGGVVVASHRDPGGQSGFSTSQPVCDMCAVDPERAIDAARFGMKRGGGRCPPAHRQMTDRGRTRPKRPWNPYLMPTKEIAK